MKEKPISRALPGGIVFAASSTASPRPLAIIVILAPPSRDHAEIFA
jgi:hypothetical protein